MLARRKPEIDHPATPVRNLCRTLGQHLILFFAFVLCAGPSQSFAQTGGAVESDTPVLVEVETELGSFVAALFRDAAPGTVANFLAYVDSSYYDGGVFFRTVRDDNQPDNPVKIDVVQARPPRDRVGAYPAIPIERTRDTGLSHVGGALSMARSGPDTATSHFFICIGDQPELDYGGKRNPDGQGFAVFGLVLTGMDVVNAIHRREAKDQTLEPPVEILSVTRVHQR